MCLVRRARAPTLLVHLFFRVGGTSCANNQYFLSLSLSLSLSLYVFIYLWLSFYFTPTNKLVQHALCTVCERVSLCWCVVLIFLFCLFISFCLPLCRILMCSERNCSYDLRTLNSECSSGCWMRKPSDVFLRKETMCNTFLRHFFPG